VVVAVTFVSAMVALYEAIDRLINPKEPSHLWVLSAAGVIGFLGNEIAAQVRLRAGRKLASPALVADGNHARVDGFVSLGVVASAAVVALGFPRADPVVGLLITRVILKITWDSWRTIRATEPGEGSRTPDRDARIAATQSTLSGRADRRRARVDAARSLAVSAHVSVLSRADRGLEPDHAHLRRPGRARPADGRAHRLTSRRLVEIESEKAGWRFAIEGSRAAWRGGRVAPYGSASFGSARLAHNDRESMTSSRRSATPTATPIAGSCASRSTHPAPSSISSEPSSPGRSASLARRCARARARAAARARVSRS